MLTTPATQCWKCQSRPSLWWPLQMKLSSSCNDLLRKLLARDKLTVAEIMKQPWFLVDFPKGLKEMNSYCLKMKAGPLHSMLGGAVTVATPARILVCASMAPHASRLLLNEHQSCLDTPTAACRLVVAPFMLLCSAPCTCDALHLHILQVGPALRSLNLQAQCPVPQHRLLPHVIRGCPCLPAPAVQLSPEGRQQKVQRLRKVLSIARCVPVPAEGFPPASTASSSSSASGQPFPHSNGTTPHHPNGSAAAGPRGLTRPSSEPALDLLGRQPPDLPAQRSLDSPGVPSYPQHPQGIPQQLHPPPRPHQAAVRLSGDNRANSASSDDLLHYPRSSGEAPGGPSGVQQLPQQQPQAGPSSQGEGYRSWSTEDVKVRQSPCHRRQSWSRGQQLKCQARGVINGVHAILCWCKSCVPRGHAFCSESKQPATSYRR